MLTMPLAGTDCTASLINRELTDWIFGETEDTIGRTDSVTCSMTLTGELKSKDQFPLSFADRNQQGGGFAV